MDKGGDLNIMVANFCTFRRLRPRFVTKRFNTNRT